MKTKSDFVLSKNRVFMFFSKMITNFLKNATSYFKK